MRRRQRHTEIRWLQEREETLGTGVDRRNGGVEKDIMKEA